MEEIFSQDDASLKRKDLLNEYKRATEFTVFLYQARTRGFKIDLKLSVDGIECSSGEMRLREKGIGYGISGDLLAWMEKHRLDLLNMIENIESTFPEIRLYDKTG